jgi:hypothetical protein
VDVDETTKPQQLKIPDLRHPVLTGTQRAALVYAEVRDDPNRTSISRQTIYGCCVRYAHYQYMKTVLQLVQWMRGPDRWVLKCPQHLEQLGPLLATFPDATIVMTTATQWPSPSRRPP